MYAVNGTDWHIFASKRRNLIVHPRYYLEKRMVCFQRMGGHAAQQCRVSKSLNFKGNLTAEESLEKWKAWNKQKNEGYHTAVAELRNF